MRIKWMSAMMCVACVCFLLAGCSKGLSTADFMNAYNDADKGVEFSKVVSYMYGEHELYNSQMLIVSEKDGKKMLTLKTVNKELNQISLQDTTQYRYTEKILYYCDGQIGESADGSAVQWRAGLVQELIDEWGSGGQKIYANYFDDMKINDSKRTLTASVKANYCDDILAENVEDLTITITLNSDKTMQKATFEYAYNGSEWTIDFGVKYK